MAVKKRREERLSEMLTTSEAAARLETSQGTIRVWLKAGRFPNATHFGRDWMIPATDLSGFVKRGAGRPKKAPTSKSTKRKAA
jgi:excisionase family DNA binding protein